MIELSFHRAWLLIAAIVVIGIYFAYPYWRHRNERIGGFIGGTIALTIVVITVLSALALGGMLIW